MIEGLEDYILDNWGECTRSPVGNNKNACYWGKDSQGKDNGCLKTVWLGRACPHWKPIEGDRIDQIREVYNTGNVEGES